MTFNPKCPQIVSVLRHGQKAHDRPDLCARIFNLQVKELIADIKDRGIFGPVEALHAVVETHPHLHVHLTVSIRPEYKPKTVDDIDRIISAEIPDPSIDPDLHDKVIRYMIHHQCDKDHARFSCYNETTDKCRWNFGDIEYSGETTWDNITESPVYRRRSPEQGGQRVYLNAGSERGRCVDNRWVASYNPYLLKKYDCHVHVQVNLYHVYI